MTKLWLDRKVSADLDQSVPMVGAPQAWAAGLDGTGVTVAVLDTGIDPAHPDLAGKVVDSRSFVPGVASADDGHGHGTHVASTITGSGAASGGRYKGMAPGVRLMVGKVLNDSGSGEMSGIIEGMEWAARGGADVINMSLGACCTDGTDETAQALNALTEQTGALFVVAAGNSGADERIGTPGAADAALTVAAVDKSDRLAGFSSRGPRLGDGALKPDIAGPGVNIVAARAAGTTMPGSVHVGEQYTTVSGTSMATPHVAGAAAILVQQHPDWTPTQLKAALMSASKDDGFTGYQQGAGRLDVARVTTQQVVATTASVDYRIISGTDPDPVSRDVTYRNLGDTDVTLTLSTGLRSVGGVAADGVLSTDPTVSVPAGGSATVTVTADAAGLANARYTGALVADAPSVRVTTPVGLLREPQRFTLTVHTIGRDGQPANPVAQDTIDVAGEQGLVPGATLTDTGTVAVRVTAGTYSVTQLLNWVDGDSRLNTAWLSDPEVVVTGDTELTFDARTASQIRLDTPLPSLPSTDRFTTTLHRSTAGGEQFSTDLVSLGADRLWATPTEPAETGGLWFKTGIRLAPPELTMSVPDSKDLTLDPLYTPHNSPAAGKVFVHFPERKDLPLVDVGLGRPEDIAGLDLREKLVMLHTDLAVNGFGDPLCGIRLERIEPIRDAGAAGILAFPGADTGCPTPLPVAHEQGTPSRPPKAAFASVPTKQGLALRAESAQRPVTVRTGGQIVAPYTYALAPYEMDRIPDSLHYRFTDRDLARIDLTYQSPLGPGGAHADVLYPLRADDTAPASTRIDGMHTGATRREYVGPLSADVMWARTVSYQRPGVPGTAVAAGGPQVFDHPVRIEQRYLSGPRTPGTRPVDPAASALLDGVQPSGNVKTDCVVCRQGDTLFPQMPMTSASNGLAQSDLFTAHPTMEDWRDLTLTLTRDGVPVPADPPILGVVPRFTLPAEEGQYRLTADGPDTDTTWTFRSARSQQPQARPGYLCAGILIGMGSVPCQAQQVLFAGYDLGDTVDQSNRVAAGRLHQFRLTVGNPQTPTAPTITSARLWTSVDEGRHWIPALLLRHGNGQYTALTLYPPLGSTSGTVSLKVQATDSAGNTVDQTSLRAITLYDPRAH